MFDEFPDPTYIEEEELRHPRPHNLPLSFTLQTPSLRLVQYLRYHDLLSALFLKHHPATPPHPGSHNHFWVWAFPTLPQVGPLSTEENNPTPQSTYSLGSLSCWLINKRPVPAIHYRTLVPVYPVARGDCHFHGVRQEMDSEAGSAPGPGSPAVRGCSFFLLGSLLWQEALSSPSLHFHYPHWLSSPPLCCILTPLLLRVPI